MINFKLIGKRVKEIRIMKGFSQAELAAKAKTSAQYLSQIENGRKQASLQVLVTLAEVLEVSLNDFLSGNQVGNILEYKGELENIFDDCSPYEKRVLFELLKTTKEILKENGQLLERDILKI